MHFFKPTPGLEYVPAKLSQGVEWCVYFYVTDPVTGMLRRIRMKINRIKNKRERLRIARQMINALNERLALGWNPLVEKVAPNSGTDISEAFDAFLQAKKKTAAMVRKKRGSAIRGSKSRRSARLSPLFPAKYPSLIGQASASLFLQPFYLR